MPANLPPLSSVRAFEAVCRHLSFTKAGDELGMTQAAVSYQIKVLEEKLGLQLFVRKTRKIELTEHGAQLAGKTVDAFALLRSAFEDVLDQNAGQLTVSSNTTFAVNWLANRLIHFQMENPDLAVRILPYGPNARPDFSNCDVAVSACTKPDSGWISHEIVPADFSPMVTPELAASIGGITVPKDLLKLSLVDPHDPWWRTWFAAAGLPHVDLSDVPNTHMGSQALAANRALSGQGPAILTPYFCKAEIDSGQLIQPFDLTCRADDESWYLSYPPAYRTSRKTRLFREWVYAELKKDGVWKDIPEARTL